MHFAYRHLSCASIRLHCLSSSTLFTSLTYTPTSTSACSLAKHSWVDSSSHAYSLYSKSLCSSSFITSHICAALHWAKFSLRSYSACWTAKSKGLVFFTFSKTISAIRPHSFPITRSRHYCTEKGSWINSSVNCISNSPFKLTPQTRLQKCWNPANTFVTWSEKSGSNYANSVSSIVLSSCWVGLQRAKQTIDSKFWKKDLIVLRSCYAWAFCGSRHYCK